MPKFEYDFQKSKDNFKKHRLTFEQAKLLWNRTFPLLIEEDDRFDYGERRYKATGLLPNLVCIVVIFTPRGRTTRIISARFAESKERKNYYAQSGYTPGS